MRVSSSKYSQSMKPGVLPLEPRTGEGTGMRSGPTYSCVDV